MIPSCFIIHDRNDGGSSSPSSSFPTTVTNKAPMMSTTTNAVFDSSLDKIMAGLYAPRPPAAAAAQDAGPSASVPMAIMIIPPPPSLSRIIASKRYHYSSENRSDEESTSNAEAQTSVFNGKEDSAIQEQRSSSSSCIRRDSLLAALALGSSPAKPSCSKEEASNDLLKLKPQTDDRRQAVQKCIKTGKRRRRVCFAEHATCYPPSIHHSINGEESSCIAPQEQESYWYSRQDLGEIKRMAKRSCQGLNLDLALNKVYNKLAASNSQDDDDDDGDSTSIVDSTLAMAARELQQLQHFEMQRGLERWSSRFQMFSRCVTILQAKTEVILEQGHQQLLHNERLDAEQLRQVVRASSRKSARYARLLGLVDAHAAGMVSLTAPTTNPVGTDDDDNKKSTATTR